MDGSLLRQKVKATAPMVPSTPPARLRMIDSMRIIRMIRPGRQPIARRMPISRVRSKTDMTMVLSMPMAPMNTATTEVSQAMPVASFNSIR